MLNSTTTMGLLMVCLCLVAPSAAKTDDTAAQSIPKEVQTYISQRDMCDHFRGEIAGNPDVDKDTNLKIDKYCAGADRGLKELRSKYKSNAVVMKKLASYEECISTGCGE